MLEYIIKYDPGAADIEEVDEGVILDYDDKGEVIGIEL